MSNAASESSYERRWIDYYNMFLMAAHEELFDSKDVQYDREMFNANKVANAGKELADQASRAKEIAKSNKSNREIGRRNMLTGRLQNPKS